MQDRRHQGAVKSRNVTNAGPGSETPDVQSSSQRGAARVPRHGARLRRRTRSSRSRSRPTGSSRRPQPADGGARKASQMGLRTLALPEDLGGVGADALTCCIVTEELAAGDPDVAAVLARDLGARPACCSPRDDDGAARALPAAVPGGRRLSSGARRPRARRRHRARHQLPPAAPTSAARRPTAAARAAMTGSSTAPRTASPMRRSPSCSRSRRRPTRAPALFLVPRDTPGLTVTETARAALVSRRLRQRSTLKDCRVPADNLLGIGERGLDRRGRRGAPLAQALNLGIGRAAYEAALDYAQLRVQGGRRIIEHQAIGTKLAEIAIRLEIARNAIWQAAWASDHPEAFADRSLPDLPLATIAKVFTVGGDLSRRQGRRRMLRRHGRDARHAAAEIHPRRADLPAHRRRQRRRQAAHRRSAGGLPARAPPMLAAE